MRRFSFAGSPARMGESYGEALRGEIRELYSLRVANARLERVRS